MSIVTTTEVERASDQQLQQEVAQPTGALGPAYVVVGEILKRKQMREGAPQKEMPRSTVKEDVARGLNAMPQAAMSAAGRDVMSQMPPQMMPPMMPPPQMPPQQMPPQQGMADGGIVAFRNGGLTAAEEMGLLGGELTLKDIPRTLPFGRSGRQIINPKYEKAVEYLQNNTPTKSFLNPKELETYTERSGAEDREEYESKFKDLQKFATDFPAYKLGDAAMREDTGKEDKQKDQKEIDLFANNQKKIIKDQMPGSMLPDLSNLKKATDELINFSSISDKELNALRSKAETEYEDERKDIFKVFESSIKDARKEKKDIKKNNFNDALIAAGAAILQAPGGQGLQWLGKGLSTLQKKFEEGRSMLRSANKDLRSSEMAFEQARELQRQGKESAADKAEARALSLDSRGKEKLRDKVTGFFTMVEATSNLYKLQTDRESAKSQLAYLKFRSGATDDALKAAERANKLTDEFEEEFQLMSGPEQKRTGFNNARDYAENKLIAEQEKYNYMQNPNPLNSGIKGVSPTIPFNEAIGEQIRNQLLK